MCFKFKRCRLGHPLTLSKGGRLLLLLLLKLLFCLLIHLLDKLITALWYWRSRFDFLFFKKRHLNLLSITNSLSHIIYKLLNLIIDFLILDISLHLFLHASFVLILDLVLFPAWANYIHFLFHFNWLVYCEREAHIGHVKSLLDFFLFVGFLDIWFIYCIVKESYILVDFSHHVFIVIVCGSRWLSRLTSILGSAHKRVHFHLRLGCLFEIFSFKVLSENWVEIDI